MARKEFAKLLKDEIKKGDQPGIAFWGDSRLPRSKETNHILLCGATGSGKTQIMYPWVEQVLKRGEKAIIWDVKGTYTQALMGKPGVDLLAPWDKRSLVWLMGKDVRDSEDAGEMAKRIIPDPKNEPNAFFDRHAQGILTQVLKQLESLSFTSGEPWGWSDHWNIVGYGPRPLKQFLERNAEGQSVIEGVLDVKSGGDVGSTLKSYLGVVESLAKAWPHDGISLRDWIRNKEDPTQVLILGGIPQRQGLARSLSENDHFSVKNAHIDLSEQRGANRVESVNTPTG